MSGFLQDLRYAARGIRRSPGFSAVAILILGLGTGASTTIFSLVDALYWKTLPAREPARLVEIYQTRRPGEYFNLSYLDYLSYRAHTRSLLGLAAHYSHAPINMTTAGGSREINGSVATASYFDVLGLTPRLGRFFTPEEDRVPGRDPVAVIGFGLWQREFGGDRGILGRVLRLNGTPFTVIGVAPENFHGVPLGGLATEVWIPSAMFHVGYRYCDAFAPGCSVVTMIGRLAPGRTLEDAREELAVEARDLAAADPATHRGLGLFVTPARGVDPEYRREMGTVAPLLLAFSGLLLAAACANLAGLLLARASVRQREIAIRTALGAGRGRLVRQLLVESILLSLGGGALGLVLAFWGKDLVAAFYAADSEGRAAYLGLALDPIVLAAASFTGMATGILFGLTPALHSTRSRPGAGFHETASASGADRRRLRDVLVIGQVAISVVLVTGACLLVRSIGRVYQGPGFDPSRIVLLRLRPSLVAYGPDKASAFQREVIRRLSDVPGVVSASPAERPPLPGWGGDLAVWLPGHEPELPGQGLHVLHNRVGPRYFETLGVRIAEGREFDERDRKGTPGVAIVNESLAARLWPRGGALGSIVVAEGTPLTVIGVVRDVQYRSPAQPPPPFLYASYWQTPTIDDRPIDSRTHVRVEGDPREVLQRVRREIATLDPEVPISEDRPLTEWLVYSFQPLRVAGAVLLTFGGLALLLAAIGLYGLLAYTVGRRTRDIAIRMALGADARRVARSVWRRGAVLASIGAILGLVAVLTSHRVLDRFLVGIPPDDPIALAAATVLLVAVAALASYLPARKASRIDPLVALRTE